jgi:hypothetical protein
MYRLCVFLLYCCAAFGQAAWSPASISGCQLFFRADDLALGNGAAVSSWPSRCGSHTATAVSAGIIALGGGPNGHNSVTFDGTTSVYSVDWNSVPLTIFSVYKQTASYDSYRGLIGADAAGTTFGAYKFSSSDASTSALPSSITYQLDGTVTAATAEINQNGVWTMLSGGLSGSTANIRFHRVQTGTASGAGATQTVSAGSTRLGAEYYSHSVTDYFGGGLVELIAFDRYLSPDEIVAVETYQEQRYFSVWNRSKYILYGFASSGETLAAQIGNDAVMFTNVDTSPQFMLRDPSIIYYKGKYWMVATGCHSVISTCTFGSVDNKSFDLYSSIGGGVWKYQQAVTANAGGGGNDDRTWAPEWFVDKDASLHVFIGAGTQGNEVAMQIYEVHPTNSTLTTWSAPTLVNTSGVNSGNVMDPFIRIVGDTYYLLLTYAAPVELVRVMTSTSLMGPYTYLADLTGREGNALIRVGSVWRDFSFGFNPCKYQDSVDLTNWTTTSNCNTSAIGGTYLEQGTPRRTTEFVAVGAVGQ